jgi:uncharacterized damage-inducible protein DinB
MIDATFVSTPPAAWNAAWPAGTIRPLLPVLDQLAEVVRGLTTEQYTTPPVGVVESSIGAHVRHCLDHIEAFLVGIEEGQIEFDHRERGTQIERSPQAALRMIARLKRRAERAASVSLEQSVRLTLLVDAAQPPISVRSSLGRELAFVISHTIHHEALIGTMVRMLGGRVPDDFGVAPSTKLHRNRS